jgi:hypothetical protein
MGMNTANLNQIDSLIDNVVFKIAPKAEYDYHFDKHFKHLFMEVDADLNICQEVHRFLAYELRGIVEVFTQRLKEVA